jgi:hypothetical protein
MGFGKTISPPISRIWQLPSMTCRSRFTSIAAIRDDSELQNIDLIFHQARGTMKA